MLDEYLVIRNLVDNDICKKLADRLKAKESSGSFYYDSQCPSSPAVENAVDDLAEFCRKKIEKEIDNPLWNTYNYSRIYKTGEILIPHKDKNQCEVAVSITLECNNEPWPIFLYSNKEQRAIEFNLNVGDALVYKGFDLLHWRNKYAGLSDQVQSFLFYSTDDRFVDPFLPGIEKLVKRDYEWLL